mmetsp:Transcript_36178/g.78964  ORF Transcript_36178/g.78964 Transcript_36178/m.78964 type:complete len:444 (-) Transcript_36178:23-1354(-)
MEAAAEALEDEGASALVQAEIEKVRQGISRVVGNTELVGSRARGFEDSADSASTIDCFVPPATRQKLCELLRRPELAGLRLVEQHGEWANAQAPGYCVRLCWSLSVAQGHRNLSRALSAAPPLCRIAKKLKVRGTQMGVVGEGRGCLPRAAVSVLVGHYACLHSRNLHADEMTITRQIVSYYARQFDWQRDCVTVNMGALEHPIRKVERFSEASSTQWFIEAPASPDYGDNLAKGLSRDDQFVVLGFFRSLSSSLESEGRCGPTWEMPSPLCHWLRIESDHDNLGREDVCDLFDSLEMRIARVCTADSSAVSRVAFICVESVDQVRRVRTLNGACFRGSALLVEECSAWAVRQELGDSCAFLDSASSRPHRQARAKKIDSGEGDCSLRGCAVQPSIRVLSAGTATLERAPRPPFVVSLAPSRHNGVSPTDVHSVPVHVAGAAV